MAEEVQTSPEEGLLPLQLTEMALEGILSQVDNGVTTFFETMVGKLVGEFEKKFEDHMIQSLASHKKIFLKEKDLQKLNESWHQEALKTFGSSIPSNFSSPQNCLKYQNQLATQLNVKFQKIFEKNKKLHTTLSHTTLSAFEKVLNDKLTHCQFLDCHDFEKFAKKARYDVHTAFVHSSGQSMDYMQSELYELEEKLEVIQKKFDFQNQFATIQAREEVRAKVNDLVAMYGQKLAISFNTSGQYQYRGGQALVNFHSEEKIRILTQFKTFLQKFPPHIVSMEWCSNVEDELRQKIEHQFLMMKSQNFDCFEKLKKSIKQNYLKKVHTLFQLEEKIQIDSKSLAKRLTDIQELCLADFLKSCGTDDSDQNFFEEIWALQEEFELMGPTFELMNQLNSFKISKNSTNSMDESSISKNLINFEAPKINSSDSLQLTFDEHHIEKLLEDDQLELALQTEQKNFDLIPDLLPKNDQSTENGPCFLPSSKDSKIEKDPDTELSRIKRETKEIYMSTVKVEVKTQQEFDESVDKAKMAASTYFHRELANISISDKKLKALENKFEQKLTEFYEIVREQFENFFDNNQSNQHGQFASIRKEAKYFHSFQSENDLTNPLLLTATLRQFPVAETKEVASSQNLPRMTTNNLRRFASVPESLEKKLDSSSSPPMTTQKFGGEGKSKVAMLAQLFQGKKPLARPSFKKIVTTSVSFDSSTPIRDEMAVKIDSNVPATLDKQSSVENIMSEIQNEPAPPPADADSSRFSEQMDKTKGSPSRCTEYYHRSMSGLKTPVVIDNGSGFLKAGLSDAVEPQIVFPSIVGRRRNPSPFDNRDSFVGEEVQEKRWILKTRAPIGRLGVIDNWDDMELIWDHTLTDQLLLSSTTEHPLLLTVNACTPKNDREKMAEIMFEKFDIPALHMAIPAVLSFHWARGQAAVGELNGIGVELGHSVTEIVPIKDGVPISHLISSLDLGGGDLTDYLVKLLMMEGRGQKSIRTSADHEAVRKIKENVCHVAQNFEQESLAPTLDLMYELPDGHMITVGRERVQCPEGLFDGAPLLSARGYKIQDAIWDCVEKTSENLCESLLSNIVISGGNSLFPGFSDRLKKEIVTRVPEDSLKKKVCVISKTDRKFGAWLGGAVVASSPDFDHLVTTLKEYEEGGSSVIRFG